MQITGRILVNCRIKYANHAHCSLVEEYATHVLSPTHTMYVQVYIY